MTQYLINLKGFFEPIRSFVEIPFVTSHCSKTQITCGPKKMNEIHQTITVFLLVLNFTSVFTLTVHIVWMLSQDVFVQFLCFMEFTHRLVQTGQIVGCGHGNGIVVMLIMFSFSSGPLQ